MARTRARTGGHRARGRTRARARTSWLWAREVGKREGGIGR